MTTNNQFLKNRRKTKTIYIGNVPIGGDNPIVVQSMTKTDTLDINSTIKQIKSLEKEGCEIIRIAVPNMDSAKVLNLIKKAINIPLIADIHFDWRIALEAIEQGIDGLRINPGNIGAIWKIKEIIKAAKERSIPIRIGVNAGSIEKDILRKYGHPTPEALVESAAKNISILEDLQFDMIKVSLKASDVLKTVKAYKIFSEKYDYPVHIGISEAGPPPYGIIKSSIGLGILLSEGIGDTIRVSLTAKPEEEVIVAYGILSSLGLRQRGVDIISCPTCGRCKIDIINLTKKVQKKLKKIEEPLKIAVMGCVVNGPGEAKEADIGIAGTKGRGIVFKKGKIIKQVDQNELLNELTKECMNLIKKDS
jgi:(E)-4-hydroxy-3-methylbut-2-enyl-diphosphate synthase